VEAVHQALGKSSNIMKKIIIFISTLIFFNLSFAERIPVPELKSSVTDLTGTISKTGLSYLQSKLKDFEKADIGQIVVLIIPTTGEESIEEYSIRLAEKWEIGSTQNNDGVILLVAKDDRKLRIEVGYGLESIITDAEASYIINYIIVPEFKSGDFYNGINLGINRIIGLIQGNISPKTESEIEDLEKTNETSKNFVITGWAFILMFLFMLAQFVPFLLMEVKLYIFFIYLAFLAGLDFIPKLLFNKTELTIIALSVSFFLCIIPLIVNIALTKKGLKGKKTRSWGNTTYKRSSSNNWSSSSSSSGSSSSSYSSGSSGSYSGGGGSFGGGGASGSW